MSGCTAVIHDSEPASDVAHSSATSLDDVHGIDGIDGTDEIDAIDCEGPTVDRE